MKFQVQHPTRSVVVPIENRQEDIHLAQYRELQKSFSGHVYVRAPCDPLRREMQSHAPSLLAVPEVLKAIVK